MDGRKYYLTFLFLLMILACSQDKVRIHQTVMDSLDPKKIEAAKSIERIDSLMAHGKSYDEWSLAWLDYQKGISLMNLGEERQSLEYLERCLTQFTKLDDKTYITKAHLFLGTNNAFLRNTETASTHLLQALEMCKELDNPKLLAKIYSSLSHIFYLHTDMEKSIAYMIRCMEIQEKEKDTFALSGSYNNMAILYKNIGKFDMALEYNMRSMELNKKYQLGNGIAKSHTNIGRLYDMMGNRPEAEKHFLKAIDITEENQIKNSIPARNLGDFYQKINWKKAIDYYQRALDVEKSSGNNTVLKNIYNAMMTTAINAKDFESAVLYQQKEDSISTLLTWEANEKKIDKLRDKHQLVISQNRLEQERKINTKNRIIFFSALGLLVLIGLFLFQRIKNAQLVLEQETMALEQEVLRSQMNPHFIFNSLSAIQDSLLDHEPLQSASYLSRFAKLMRQNFEFTNKKYISLDDETSALENYLSTQNLRYGPKLEWKIQIDPNIDGQVAQIPPMLLQPLVENAIEHGFKNKKGTGHITIAINNTENAICYHIQDNGKGIEPKARDNKAHSLDILKKRLRLLGNKDEETFEIHSTEQGTTVKFCLRK
ncbi:MAG: tetratricopeptide repeat protein [Flavobacteriaceae bacterium]